MSLKHLAKQLESRGRNGDTELVHMSKEEVKALQGLASIGGTHMTRNPDTGLHEAFNMKSLIPIAAGIGGSFVGMPWLGALAAAGMTTAETGSLSKGLMAGVGSYALGGLGSAALGAGGTALASGAADAATQAGTQAAADAAAQGATQGVGDAAAQAATQGAMQQGLQQGAGDLAGQFSAGDIASQMAQQQGGNAAMQQSLGQSFPSLSSDQLAQVTSEGTPDLMAQRAAMLDRFGQANYSMSPSGAVTQAPPIGGNFNPSATDKLGALSAGDYMNIAKDNPGAVLGTGTMLMDAFSQQPGPPKEESDDSVLSRAHLVPDYYTRNSRQFATGGLASLPPKAYACGGPVAFDGGGPVGMGGNTMYPQSGVQSPMYNQPTQMPMERSVLRTGYEQMTDEDTGDQVFAAGGLTTLRHGRAIRGPGDGMSDNVPATIGGVEPARLADGEYVVPADAVSHIGNGSTDAGVRKLDGMMSRIRKARTGNQKQGKQIRAEKFMPA